MGGSCSSAASPGTAANVRRCYGCEARQVRADSGWIWGKLGGMTVRTYFGAFALDSDLRQVTCEGREIHLTPKAFDLLTLLIADAGRVMTKKELHERLWPDSFVSDATLV